MMVQETRFEEKNKSRYNSLYKFIKSFHTNENASQNYNGDLKNSSRKKNKLTITLLPGFDCNLKCKMCFNWKVQRKEFLSSEDWVNLVEYVEDALQKDYTAEISIGGGEPYLHNCVFDIMKVSKKKEFRCSISTNGSILTKSIIDRSIESGLRGINISLDSLNEEVHDTYRGMKGSYSKVLKAI